ncbi:MAG: 50S ribosomal protein L32 [Planctomycetes bacterium]|nr:50S ribosomal protein L32 [Planctomycetota bacterium]
MAVPKRKSSKSRTRKRRANKGVKPIQLSECPQCHTRVITHVSCPTCGYYQGRTVVEVTEG